MTKIDGMQADYAQAAVTETKSAEYKKIPIVEIFGPTIQGEGNVIGYQTSFVRFGGCDYRCERCDSLHAVLPELVKANATYMTQHELIEAVEAQQGHTKWITLSGGNPCMWDIGYFIRHFGKKRGTMIALETQGTIWREWIPYCNRITVSPKGPGMGEKFEPDKFEVFIQKVGAHSGFSVKVPVFDQRDLELAVEIMQKWPTTRNKMFLSIGNYYPPKPAERGPKQMPMYALDSAYDDENIDLTQLCLDAYRRVLEEVMQDPRLAHVRILPQMHVLLWGNQLGR